MQTNQETPSVLERPTALERRLDMAVALADIDKDVEQRLKKMARNVKMPGFRPGKVPFKIVVQQYGYQARSEAIGAAVERAFGAAVREQNIRVAGQPRIEPKGGADQSVLEFSAVFEVYPEIHLGDISGQTIERQAFQVTEAELDKTIEVLRKQRTTYAAAARAAASGDRVTIDFTGRLDGEVFKGGQASDYPVVLGEGRMLPDFEQGVIGLSAGESKTFEVTFPADYQVAELAGKQVSFEVTVKGVEGPQLPEVDAGFVRALGIADGDVAKMRAEVMANLEREVRKRLQARTREQAMEALLAATPIEAPKALVEQESRAMADAALQDLANRGMDVKHVPVEPGWFTEQATRRVKLGLIIAEVVKQRALHASPEQVRAQVDELAQSYEDPAELVRWYYGRPERLAPIEAMVLEQNVVAWALENAGVSDKTVSFDELMGPAA